MAKDDKDKNYKVIAENRRARYDYAIEDDIECGIMLEGSEVKSLRQGGANIAESYAEVKEGELWLVNGYIAPYAQAKTFGHEERRRRKLLVRSREMSKLWNATAREGYTLVPLVMYFNHRGMVKLKIGVGKGKKNHDKRETAAKRDWQRQKARLMKDPAAFNRTNGPPAAHVDPFCPSPQPRAGCRFHGRRPDLGLHRGHGPSAEGADRRG